MRERNRGDGYYFRKAQLNLSQFVSYPVGRIKHDRLYFLPMENIISIGVDWCVVSTGISHDGSQNLFFFLLSLVIV